MGAQGRIRASNRIPADVKYFQTFFGHQLRPNGQMPVEAHRECGRLLHLVSRATEGRPGAHETVKYVCHTLDDWAMREFDQSQLNNEMLAGLYCPGPRMKPEDRVGLRMSIEILERVKAILGAHYPHGVALQRVWRELDRAIASISKWDGKPRGKIYREPIQRRKIKP